MNKNHKLNCARIFPKQKKAKMKTQDQSQKKIMNKEESTQLLGLLKGASVAEMKEIVDPISIDTRGTVGRWTRIRRGANDVVLGSCTVVNECLPLLLCFSNVVLHHRKRCSLSFSLSIFVFSALFLISFVLRTYK